MIKPILFNTDMVRAIMDGRKTVTRRVVKPQYGVDADDGIHLFDAVEVNRFRWSDIQNIWTAIPYPYHPGDILYVRETWNKVKKQSDPEWHYEYRASCPDPHWFSNGFMAEWRPSIHMPREAARIFLRVTDVRVERLQDPFFKHGSTIFSLQGEGIDIGEHCRECIEAYGSPCCIDDESECGVLDEVRGDFSVLWNRTIKPSDLAKYIWGVNPWVWVIEFERCEKPREGAQ